MPIRYDGKQIVDAKYTKLLSGNPFLDAMPEPLSCQELLDKIQSVYIPFDGKADKERRRAIAALTTLFFPMDYMYTIYDQFYRAILTTYMTYETVEYIRKINQLFCDETPSGQATQAESGSVLGVPGVGKTSTIRRCLSVMPQVICHTKYRGEQFYCKQVLYLRVECPSDCSVRTLALNIITSLDKALGSEYMSRFEAVKSFAVSALATQVKILCLTHHVGLVVVDEIQNAVLTARANKQMRSLIRFLVELTNDTSTAIFFAGTLVAEEMFLSQEHLKRRSRGIRLLPMKKDGVYRKFLERLWKYQFTDRTAQLTENLINQIYECSGGVPSYIVKIFQESQNMALMNGSPCIGAKTIQQTVDMLAIKVPKAYTGGTSISSFAATEIPLKESVETTQSEHRRGRKAVGRDSNDLLVAYKDGKNLLRCLEEWGLKA